ncbi:glucosaminidase domain-containing protein [Staphylococcus americanisciuri]|uniref:Glucosaminidase domain-containing protein n=1 Tax=Staphylococcus americanisciuri TaxID=2973940 RepID=A0ABT2F513_9STAP|nr:glucosaminidase domain-containing protein [Staphylococcus americanisciuri]MCS4487121.1 glucosaminidase domain-containing protein [Staphylococcus americanisciuri]
MKGKVLLTGLLTTALVASPTTGNLAEAASQKAQTALEKDLTTQSDNETSTSPLDIVTTDDDNATQDDEHVSKQRDKQQRNQTNKTTTSSKTQQQDIDIMDAFDRWLYNTATGNTDASTHDTTTTLTQNNTTQDIGIGTQDIPQTDLTPAPEPSLSTDERDFFDNLNAILNETTPFDDMVASDNSITDDTTTDTTDDSSDVTTVDESTQTEDVTNDTETSDTNETTNTDDNSTDTDDKTDINDTPTDDTNAATQEGKTSIKDDVMIEALLDSYSDKAEKTQTQQQSQNAKRTSNNPQIPASDTYTGSREQAPAQTFEDLPKHSQMRQTTWFQERPSTHNNNDTGVVSDIRIAPNQSTRAFINDIAEDAHRIGQEQNLYASVMIAQAILESDSGRSALAQSPNYNLFGMKGAYQGQKVAFNTLESNGKNMYQIQADFRKYPNKKASLEDYATLIKGGIDGNPTIYKGVWKSESSSYRTAVSELVGTYATDPNYDTKLKQLIQTYDLTRFDQKKMPKLLEADIVTNGENISGNGFKAFRTTGSSPYPQGQCTWYVYHRMAQFGKSIAGNMGNAAEWTGSAYQKGYKVTGHPTKHSAVVFQPGQLGADSYYGHVAFVEQVRSDGSIVISESNVKGLGVISYRTIDATSAQSLDYIVR